MRLPEFCPDQTASAADSRLRESLRIAERAEHCALLWFAEILRRKLYSELGYGTMRAYALEELGFSSAKAGDFMRLASRLDELPALKAEIESGRVGYTVAREIMPVVDASNEKKWVGLAVGASRRKVRQAVKQAKQEAAREKSGQGELVPREKPVPVAQPRVRVEFSLTASQYAVYEAQLAKLGSRGDKAELLLEMVGALWATDEKVAPREATSEPHYQVHVHQCPDCAKATVATPRGEVELSTAEAETALCDAIVHEPGGRNKTAIAPSVRRDVLTRDRHQCRRKGCAHTRYLDLHHIVTRSAGGSNEKENLVTLCGACHRQWHRHGGALREMLREVE